jgi:hypothetical protein
VIFKQQLLKSAVSMTTRRYLLKVKRAGQALLNYELHSKEWLHQIDVLAGTILERNSFCRSQLQVSQDLYEVLKQTMAEPLIVQMADQRSVQKLCFELDEEQWNQNQDAQSYLLEWVTPLKEHILKQVYMSKPNPDQRFTWLDLIAITAQQQARSTMERTTLLDELFFALRLLKKFRQCNSKDSLEYRQIYNEALNEMQTWLYTGEASQESKLSKDENNNIPGIEVWDPEQAWGKDKKNIGLSFSVFFKNQFKWTLQNLWRHHGQNAAYFQDDDDFLKTLVGDWSDDDDDTKFSKRLEAAIKNPQKKGFMESRRMNTNHDATLLIVVVEVIKYAQSLKPGEKIIKYKLWNHVGDILDVDPDAVRKFFNNYRDDLLEGTTD